MRTKILRNIFTVVGALFMLARLLFAGTSDGVLNFGNMPLEGRSPTYTSFDAPGAVFTLPLCINPAGVIAGFYGDTSFVPHGFLRSRDGTITTFDAAAGSVQIQPLSINPAGVIVGFYQDASNVFHGFLRTRDDTITTFDVPGAGTGPGQGTISENINPAGVISGGYSDSSSVFHGFVLIPDGTFTSFDAPGAGTGPGQGTEACSVDCLNPAGATAGGYADASNVFHGFVRTPDGTITTFDAPSAGTGPLQGTQPTGINPAGTIQGTYIDSSGVNHGFLRAADGTITTFDVGCRHRARPRHDACKHQRIGSSRGMVY